MDSLLIILVVALAGAVVAFALKLANLSDKKKDVELRAHQLEAQFQETSREFARYKRDTIAQLSDLRDDIRQLETDLESCVAPGARKRRLERLLAKASSGSRGDKDPPVVPGGGGSAP